MSTRRPVPPRPRRGGFAPLHVAALVSPVFGLVYFSFATLTTVGYGDVSPAWPGAGGLAVAEAFVGQLYLAITIARLVGLHASRSA